MRCDLSALNLWIAIEKLWKLSHLFTGLWNARNSCDVVHLCVFAVDFKTNMVFTLIVICSGFS